MGDLSSFLLSPCSLYIRRNGALRHRAVGENRPGLQAHTGADVGGGPCTLRGTFTWPTWFPSGATGAGLRSAKITVNTSHLCLSKRIAGAVWETSVLCCGMKRTTDVVVALDWTGQTTGQGKGFKKGNKRLRACSACVQ